MKFTDGFWRTRPGIQVYNAARIYDYEINGSELIAYAPHFDVANRGQTLWGPLLTLRLSSPMKDVIRVQVWHYKGQDDKGPNFKVDEESSVPIDIEDGSENIAFKTGNLEAKLSKGKNWNLSFFDGDKELTNSQWRCLGYATDENNQAYMKDQLALDVHDTVYGFGEKFTPFVKNGQVVDVWNADGGTSSELAYKSIPFYYCSKGYGIFVNDPGAVSLYPAFFLRLFERPPL